MVRHLAAGARAMGATRLSACAAALCLIGAEAGFGATRTVATAEELEQALQGLGPGSEVVLVDGVYATRRPILIQGARGTEQAPISVRAGHGGRAEIGGAFGFVVRDCEYVVLEGFLLTHDADQPAVLLDGSRHVRVTRNRFRLSERAAPRHKEYWVYVVGARSANNRIDHNEFGLKKNAGGTVFVRGDDAALVCSQHDRVDRNRFCGVPFVEGKTGRESIRTGGNDLGASGQSSFTVIEENLLEGCCGDEEIVSLKSSDNLVRNNTLLNCRGAICLRLGNRDTVCGNFVLNQAGAAGCGGVKLYGYDHRVYNNTFCGLTGEKHEAPLALIPGTLGEPATQRIGKAYDSLTTVPATRAWIAFNTWIDCAPLQFGTKEDAARKHLPRECAFVNNLVVRTKPQKPPLVNLGLVVGVRAVHNIGYDCERAPEEPWAGWFTFSEPRLRRADDRALPWRLSGDSPAVDGADSAGQPVAVADDAFGRPRAGKPDIGAEEFGDGAPLRRPLTAADVGPAAP